MNAETLASGRLAALLRGTAAGMLPDTAAANLIIRHGHFLHDRSFRRIIAAGASVTDGQPFAVIHWNAALYALEHGHLPCSALLTELTRPAAWFPGQACCKGSSVRGHE